MSRKKSSGAWLFFVFSAVLFSFTVATHLPSQSHYSAEALVQDNTVYEFTLISSEERCHIAKKERYREDVYCRAK